MMKKLFLTLSMLLFVLAMSTNVAWGKSTIGEPADWYYVNFTTRVSTPACGSNPGEVKLTYVDIDREIDNLQFCEPEPTVPEADASYEWAWGAPYDEGKLDAASQDTYDADYATRDWGWSCDEECMTNANRVSSLAYKAGFDYVKSNPCQYLNTTNPTNWGSSASLNGYAMMHMEGMDSLAGFTSYAYFEAKVRENDGWYFVGWSYKEGDCDLGGHVDTDTEEDKGYLFKIFPSDNQGFGNKSQAYAYATFKPVMVSKYKVNGLINTSIDNTTTVVFDVVGQRVSIADFTVSVPEANFSAEITSCVDNKVTVTVTYSGSTDGEFRGNVTLASKSGCSQLTAPVFARVGGDGSNDATLYDGKTPTSTTGTLAEMITAANGTDKIVVLNRNCETTEAINANVTINLNGYTISNTMTVNGGEVTVAYSKYGGGGNAITVNGGKLTLNGGEFTSLTVTSGIVEQNGATFSGASSNNGTLTITEGEFNGGLASKGTLTVNGGSFEGTNAITINGGTADINRGTIDGTNLGLKVTAGTVNIKKLAAIKGASKSVRREGGTVNIECGKFNGGLEGELNFISGYFVTEDDMAGLTAGKEVFQLTSGVEYNEGYRFFLGVSETAQTNGVGVCMIGDVSYARLEDALAYANNNPSVEDIVIFMTNDYILPAGYYTLPANATIVVPMSDSQQKVNLTAPRLVYNDVNNAEVDKYSNNIPFEFRRLTFANGVNMDVFGKIELTCTQYASNEAYTSQPVGAYGHLVMEEGSHMTLQNGSEVRAWGFMTGKGETDARRGSTVREMFQMGDWKGAMTSVLITGMVAGTPIESIVKNSIVGSDSGDYSDKKIFPISQYFIQNVESPVKYHPGALLSTSAAVSEGVLGMSMSMAATDIAVVGVSNEHTAIFLMDIAADAENTWVRKWYDAEHDIQVYDINSGAHIGSMELDLGGVSVMGASIPVKLNSAKFDLPITSNFKIHLLTGNMDFEQNTALLPGSEVEVDKESTVSISMNAEDKAAKAAGTANHVYHSGAVYVYDQADWDTYAYNNKYTKVVRYAPSALNGVGGQPNIRVEGTCPASAKINVHGTFNTKDGYVYTSAGGAEIVSSNEDAGSFIFNSPATDAGERDVYQIKGKGTSNSHYQTRTFTTAQLKNGNGSYTNTESAVLGGLTFIYRDGAWQEPMTPTATDVIVTYNSNCYTADVSMMSYVGQAYNVTDYSSQSAILASPLKDEVLIYYAPDKIAEYLVAKKIAAEQASYDLNAAEYEYAKAHLNDDHSGDSPEDQAKYALFAQLFPTIAPAVAAIKDAGCDFGSAVQNLYIKPQEWVEINGNAHVQLAIDDVSDFEDTYADSVSSGKYNGCPAIVDEYLDYMEANKMNLTIDGVDGNSDHTYSDAAGAGRLFILADEDACQWWEVEKKNNLYHCIHPDNDTYYYWDEDENAWLEQQFRISWKNWNGDIVQTADADGNLVDYYYVNYGTMAEFLGSNPTREETTDYTYDFTGWSPALGPVTSDVTYTATYEEKERKYTIIFLQEGGVEIERQFLTHNQMPVCENTPTKVGYTLEWTPAIKAVTGDATYTATWLEEPPTKYQITFYDYNGTTVLQQGDVNVGVVPTPPADPTGKPQSAEYSYVFDHWSPALEEVSATSAKTYTAVYREVDRTYTISYYNESGSAVVSSEELPYGATPTPPAVSKENPEAGHTYTLVWKNLAETSTIQTVQGPASYKPTYIDVLNKYTVTVKSNPSGACSSTGAGLYDYNSSATLTISVNAGYTFTGWSDGLEGTNTTRTITVTEDKELVANFAVDDPDYTIIWKNESGSANLVEPIGQKANTATVYTGATPTKAETAAKTFTFYGWSTAANGGGTIYKNGMTPKATANATYYAYFNEMDRTYTITWANEAGTANIEVDYEQPYGAAIAYNSATPTKTATAAETYAFDGWSTTVGGNAAALPATVTGDATFYAHFASTTKTYTITWLNENGGMIDQTVVAYGETPTHADATKENTAEYTYEFTGWTPSIIEVVGPATYQATFSSTPLVAVEDLEIGIGETEELTVATTKDNLIITSNGVTSGQLVGADNLNLTGDAYFDITPVGGFQARTWYTVAVPWAVDATTGIYSGTSPLALGSGIEVYYYDGATRATNGKGGNWLYLKNAGDKTMQPGTLYMIYLANNATTLRFQKKSGAGLLTTTLSVEAHPSTTGNEADAGWNGIANPALFHAYVNPLANTYSHANFGQKYVPFEERYEATNMAENPLIVGEPIFVQVAADKSDVTAVTGNPFSAPARRKSVVDNAYYEVHISAGEDYTDRIYLQTMEDKEDTYVIGLDLAKAGVSTKVAQMWVDRYNTKLCVNTTAPIGSSATYPLGIFAPQDGDYQISSATEMQQGQEMFVTYKGRAIWNLAYGPYTATLTAGNHTEYGLKLIQAPATPTGTENVQGDKVQGTKVIIDDHIYIIRGGEVYTVTGQKVQ